MLAQLSVYTAIIGDKIPYDNAGILPESDTYPFQK